MTRRLLLVAHAPSANTRRMADAVLHGACADGIDAVETLWRPPLEAAADDLLAADAVILGTTENFGYMSGALKDFFERVYYPCLERTEGLPYALYIRAGNDGSGARQSVERILAGLKWRAVQEPLLCVGPFQERFVTACEELGMTVAAGLDAGIF
jgi:multimeric flavodoxin WrbA